MNTFLYQVVSIDGDYANLRRMDIESDQLKLVARVSFSRLRAALGPEGRFPGKVWGIGSAKAGL